MAIHVPDWSVLLMEAVNTPGLLMQAYSAFHTYSTGNQLLALWQCRMRGIKPGPLNTYPGWQRLGRQVRKGEQALTLLMPVIIKDKRPELVGTDEEGKVHTGFVYKPHWFVLAQTEGEELPPVVIPAFDADRALAELGIGRMLFERLNGNCQGYASGQQIAINPLAQLPHKTFFHETGHVVLGHTLEGECIDNEMTPRNLREVEAESVALICCESLGLEGAVFCRGYIQDWLGQTTEIPDKSAQKIFRAADLILRAGKVAAQ
jgi:antirestriction protein ArdC